MSEPIAFGSPAHRALMNLEQAALLCRWTVITDPDMQRDLERELNAALEHELVERFRRPLG